MNLHEANIIDDQLVQLVGSIDMYATETDLLALADEFERLVIYLRDRADTVRKGV